VLFGRGEFPADILYIAFLKVSCIARCDWSEWRPLFARRNVKSMFLCSRCFRPSLTLRLSSEAFHRTRFQFQESFQDPQSPEVLAFWEVPIFWEEGLSFGYAELVPQTAIVLQKKSESEPHCKAAVGLTAGIP